MESSSNRQSKEFKAELLSDPKFKEAFINLLNVGADNLTARNAMAAKNKGSVNSDYRSEEQTGAGFDAVNRINDILLSYYKKFGVDRTGRRVPPGFNYTLGEAKAKQYVKPYNNPQTGEQMGWVSSDGYHKKYWQMFAKNSAIKHAKLNPDEVQEGYTGEFAAEKTPAINPYGGLKDNQFRGAISEEELDEACWKGYHKEGNKKMFGKTYPNCVKNTNEEEQLDEKCWDSHKQVGMKNKGGKQVPNCVPKESAIMKGLKR